MFDYGVNITIRSDSVSCVSGQNMPLPTDLKELYRSYQQEIHANSYNADVNTIPITSTMQSIDKK